MATASADQITTFAKIDHPRGLVWDDATRTLYVLHPPTLARYYDDNGDGVADRSETLVTGIGNHKATASRGPTTRPTASAWASTAGSTSRSATSESSMPSATTAST